MAFSARSVTHGTLCIGNCVDITCNIYCTLSVKNWIEHAGYLTLEVTNDNFHGVHRLELYIVAFLKNHCIANTGHKNINKIPLCC